MAVVGTLGRLGLLALLASGPTARADPLPAPAGGAEIVVTGTRESLARAVADVRAITAVHRGHYARFEAPVCPYAAGLAGPYKAAVEARMRSVAREAGVRVAKAGCTPNLALIVADDGGALVAALQRKVPDLFATLSGAETNALARRRGPVWSWHAVTGRRRDGGPVEPMTMLSFSPQDPGRPVAPGAFIASNVDMSRLGDPVRMEIAFSCVVVGSAAAAGLTVRQLADAAALAGLSMIRADRLPALQHASALALLLGSPEARRRIEGLTAFDRAYLRALYSGEGGYGAEQQATRIAIAMRRATPDPVD